MNWSITSYLEIIAIILIWQATLFAILSGGIYYKTKHHPKKYISIFMFVSAGYFTLVWLNFFGYAMINRFLYPLAMPLLITLFPLLYAYLRSLTNSRYKLEKWKWLHFLPPLVLLLLLLPFYFLPASEALKFVQYKTVGSGFSWLAEYLSWINRVAFYGFFTLQFLFYYLKFRTNLRLHRLRIELMFSYKENLDLRWMRYLFIGLLLFFAGNDVTYFLRDTNPYLSVSFFSIGMLLINFFIGFHSLVQSEVVENEIISRMSHYCALHREMTQPRTESQELFITRELQKYQRSALKIDTREQIILQLDQLMRDEELYKDSEINIEDLAMKLSISSKHLSQAINEVHQKNFFNYINELRIRNAKMMLTGKEHQNLSIEGIAKVVGFQSKSSFYTAFKKSTGITPTEFRDQFSMKAKSHP